MVAPLGMRTGKDHTTRLHGTYLRILPLPLLKIPCGSPTTYRRSSILPLEVETQPTHYVTHRIYPEFPMALRQGSYYGRFAVQHSDSQILGPLEDTAYLIWSFKGRKCRSTSRPQDNGTCNSLNPIKLGNGIMLPVRHRSPRNKTVY